MVALSALSAEASDRGPNGLRLRNQGWTANLFVAPARPALRIGGDADGADPVPPQVNARLWRRIAPGTRLSIEALNVFDRPAAPSLRNDLFQPLPQGRGVRIELRKTF